ncbi:hypothetical protein OsJ_24516 [Oryza sativa Japonica Group]|uniref:Secreted protein n=1 Tax=Oryza sativa subsp. japonica TaxID=39947 RepID=B9FXL4_ORYSJ|nr:hypothetical protein OsJ_24516 [Oryza sativa Japonica Group]
MGEGMMLRLLLVVTTIGGHRSDGVPANDHHATAAPPHQVAQSPATARDGLARTAATAALSPDQRKSG